MTSQQVPQVFTNFEASLQEEVDCNDMVEPEYNYNDPNHKPPFKYVDYTEVKANEDNEINCIAFGKKGKYLCEITEKNKIAYIYHDRNTNNIGIWGESRKFNKVINQINNRFEIAKQIVEANKLNNM
jgi:hypothetical protein